VDLILNVTDSPNPVLAGSVVGYQPVVKFPVLLMAVDGA